MTYLWVIGVVGIKLYKVRVYLFLFWTRKQIMVDLFDKVLGVIR